MATFIKGKSLSITIDGNEYNMEVSNLVLDSEDAADDFVTFANVGTGGGRTFFITGTAGQSLEDESLWRLIWENPGEEYTIVFSPVGTGASNTHFTGTAIVGDAPALGGEAARNGQVLTFDFRFDLTDKPTLVEGV